MIEHPLIFMRRAGGKFEIGIEALVTMQRYAQRQIGATEAGGVLLGRLIRDIDDIVVDSVTVPFPGDTRHPIRFFKHWQRHQNAIMRAWRESRGTCTYLGEWHTHPVTLPQPSSMDLQTWRQKLAQDTYHGSSLFFVIVGTEAIHAWEGYHDDQSIEQLSLLQ